MLKTPAILVNSSIMSGKCFSTGFGKTGPHPLTPVYYTLSKRNKTVSVTDPFAGFSVYS